MFFLQNPLAFCGRPWHGFRHRCTQLWAQNRAHFLHTANSPFLKTENSKSLHSTFQVMRCHCCLFKGRHASSHAPQDIRLCTNRLLWPTQDFLWQFWWAELERTAKSNDQQSLSWLKTTHKVCNPDKQDEKATLKMVGFYASTDASKC